MKYLAFDIGGTNVKWGIVNEQGTILKSGKFKSPRDSFEELIQGMGDVYRNLKTRWDFQWDFEGIAISVPGAPHDDTGIIAGGSALPYIHGPNFKEALKEEIGLKMHMENDAKCAALGEVWLGAAKDVQDCLFLVIGTGVGGAVVKDKKVHHGPNLMAGEFGYLITDYDFKEKKFIGLSSSGATGGMIRYLAKKKGVDIDEISGEEIFLDAEAGNEESIALVENFYESLAVSIFNLMYMYDPEMIVIGGAISARPDLIEKIQEKLEVIKGNFGANTDLVHPPIVKAKFEGDANLLGAVFHYLSHEGF